MLNRINFWHTQTRERYLLLVANQWQNVNNLQTSREKAKPSSPFCALFRLSLAAFPVGAVAGSLASLVVNSKEANLEAGVISRVKLRSSDGICQSTS